MILLQKVDGTFPNLIPDFLRDKGLDLFHEGRIGEITLWGPFSGSVVKSLSDGLGRDWFFEVVTELAKEFMIQGDGPVLAQELSNIRNEACIIPFGDLIQVLDTEADKGVEGGDNNFLTTKIRDSVNDAVGIDAELNIVSIEVLDIFRNQFGTHNTFFVDDFGHSVVSPLNIVIDHFAGKGAADSYGHVEFG